jgi:hypothetical protein
MKLESFFGKPRTLEFLAEQEIRLEERRAAASADLEAAERRAAEFYLDPSAAPSGVDDVLRAQAVSPRLEAESLPFAGNVR